MAALAAPGFPLGVGGPPPAAAPAAAPPAPAPPPAAPAAAPPAAAPPAAAAAAPAAPTPFTDDIMNAVNGGIVNTSAGYELPYPVYIANLEPSLKHHYPEPEVRPRAPPAPPPAAAAPAPGGDPADPEIRRIDAYIRAHRPAGWTNNIIRSIVGTARAAMAIPYDPANPGPYMAAFNGFLDTRANQLAAGLPAANVIPHVNIGP